MSLSIRSPRSAPTIALLLLPMLAGASAPAVAMVTFHVNDTNDLVDDNLADGICHTATNTCTLRAAIMQANHTEDASTIVLPIGNYIVDIPVTGDDGEEEGDLNLTATDSDAPITIVGADANMTAMNGLLGSRVLHVESGRHAVISGVDLVGGRALSGNGGAILNEGMLELDHCLIQSSGASEGGAIYNGASLRLDHSVVANSGGQGGGIRNVASLQIVDSTLSNNNGPISGGIWSSDGATTQASVRVIRSTIVGNSGDTGGFCCSGDLTLVDSTVAGNFSNSVGGGISFRAEAGRANAAALYDTTVVDNSANVAGAGIAVNGAAFDVVDSLIARNLRADGSQEQDCAGTIAARGRNLFGSTDGCAISGDAGSSGLLNSLDRLGTLADNGGPTQTIALLAGSNAIDGGDPAGCTDADGNPLTTDQRGFLRPAGAACDVGAFEYGAVDPDVIFVDGFDPPAA
ncbi:MAG TPA: choice-of-anchor Q domain-containing protein [Dokdonella sp.]